MEDQTIQDRKPFLIYDYQSELPFNIEPPSEELISEISTSLQNKLNPKSKELILTNEVEMLQLKNEKLDQLIEYERKLQRQMISTISQNYNTIQNLLNLDDLKELHLIENTVREHSMKLMNAEKELKTNQRQFQFRCENIKILFSMLDKQVNQILDFVNQKLAYHDIPLWNFISNEEAELAFKNPDKARDQIYEKMNSNIINAQNQFKQLKIYEEEEEEDDEDE